MFPENVRDLFWTITFLNFVEKWNFPNIKFKYVKVLSEKVWSQLGKIFCTHNDIWRRVKSLPEKIAEFSPTNVYFASVLDLSKIALPLQFWHWFSDSYLPCCRLKILKPTIRRTCIHTSPFACSSVALIQQLHLLSKRNYCFRFFFDRFLCLQQILPKWGVLGTSFFLTSSVLKNYDPFEVRFI